MFNDTNEHLHKINNKANLKTNYEIILDVMGKPIKSNLVIKKRVDKDRA